MKHKLGIFLSIFFLSLIINACKAKKVSSKPIPFKILGVSEDKSYGFSEKNPIHVGGVKSMQGPQNEQRYLNALLGPNGEEISYFRRGSCCSFKTPNGFMNTGLLDVYKVSWGGSDTMTLYIDMYDYGTLYAPVGFTYKK